MKKQYKDMVDTRRLYKLENDLYGNRRYSFLVRQRSEKFIVELAKIIWKGERKNKKMPIVRFGKGTPHMNLMYSWCDGTTIELAPTQRDVLTLIHELVHALGYDYHDENFVCRYRKLLLKYTPLNPQLIKDKFIYKKVKL
jgi:hypothetical protein